MNVTGKTDGSATVDLALPEASRPIPGRYSQMLANSATAVICAGPDNLIASWNSAAEQLFGHCASDAIGKPLWIIIPPQDRAAHAASFDRAVRDGRARLAGGTVEVMGLHADGKQFPVEMSLSMWTESDRPMFGALLRDVTHRQAARSRLEHLAHIDSLTSLPNRNAFHCKLTSAIGQSPVSLVLLDLDGFKYVNDSIGHSVGDQVLAAVATRLSAAVGPTGYLARLGGDEFAILLAGCVDPLEIDGCTKQIFDALHSPFELAGHSIYIGTSIGIAMAPADATTVEHLLSSADLALYSAKAEGGGTRKYFVRAMQTSAEQRHRMGRELRQAWANDEFELLYQPQLQLADKSLVGAEALLRWRHPDHGLLPPQSFISVLEDNPIAELVGDWIINRACETAAQWKRTDLGPIRVGVNLFAAQLRSGRLFNVVSAALHAHDLAPQLLELEITENTVLRYNKQSSGALSKLKALGVGIAFDDFGTGFASLSLLQKYPVTRLKIDQSFVAQVDRDSGDAAIVRAVIAMAASLNLTVIAEGLETTAQEAALLQLQCSEAQGYLYGKPMTADELVTIFSKKNIAEG